MKRILMLFTVVLAAALLFTGCKAGVGERTAEEKEVDRANIPVEEREKIALCSLAEGL